MRQVERLRSLIKESINEYIREIDEAAEKAANEARISTCEEAIQKREEKLKRVAENEDLKELASEDKIKDIQNEIKMLTELVKDVVKQNQDLTNKLVDIWYTLLLPVYGHLITYSPWSSINTSPV